MALLPRPIDNEVVKPLMVKFNRNLFAAIVKVQKLCSRVQFLQARHAFIVNSKPNLQLFNSDKVALNEDGARRFKQRVLKRIRELVVSISGNLVAT